mmetsp:Transcript_65644/g.143101  ORF Transcript_65644/g.143101 Transcript_65644/m.143101 type:complete len:89 (-) Transcript_65644:2-268(-)
MGKAGQPAHRRNLWCGVQVHHELRLLGLLLRLLLRLLLVRRSPAQFMGIVFTKRFMVVMFLPVILDEVVGESLAGKRWMRPVGAKTNP